MLVAVQLLKLVLALNVTDTPRQMKIVSFDKTKSNLRRYVIGDKHRPHKNRNVFCLTLGLILNLCERVGSLIIPLVIPMDESPAIWRMRFAALSLRFLCDIPHDHSWIIRSPFRSTAATEGPFILVWYKMTFCGITGGGGLIRVV